ncbi:hypothetical protein [Catenuloplanes atrovinosus]|uniref:Uncharacterized protein n=1 Tax=Catenuloplanes atrovinosus TaxID=137266 RepID=A0AAE3YVP7_9ACTN|nr:hypothetical protein [Catenuloplanes atrovinosus]MDR7279527.1 hypothetical protein [Catenuloplanes atrovinosus]
MPPAWRQASDRDAAWIDPQARYADLMAQLSPSPPATPGRAQRRPVNGHDHEEHPVEPQPPLPAAQVPASAPPYPYEGDLEDAGLLPRPAYQGEQTESEITPRDSWHPPGEAGWGHGDSDPDAAARRYGGPRPIGGQRSGTTPRQVSGPRSVEPLRPVNPRQPEPVRADEPRFGRRGDSPTGGLRAIDGGLAREGRAEPSRAELTDTEVNGVRLSDSPEGLPTRQGREPRDRGEAGGRLLEGMRRRSPEFGRGFGRDRAESPADAPATASAPTAAPDEAPEDAQHRDRPAYAPRRSSEARAAETDDELPPRRSSRAAEESPELREAAPRTAGRREFRPLDLDSRREGAPEEGRRRAVPDPADEPTFRQPSYPEGYPAYPPPPGLLPAGRDEFDDFGRAPEALPKRVPSDDVPLIPAAPVAGPPAADAPDLARIADSLRREDSTPERDRPDGFDVDAIQLAVREVAGVRHATVHVTESGAHKLRLDLTDGADPAEVSRMVARLLQERMGLAASSQEGLPIGGAAVPASVTPIRPPAEAPAEPSARPQTRSGVSYLPRPTAAPKPEPAAASAHVPIQPGVRPGQSAPSVPAQPAPADEPARRRRAAAPAETPVEPVAVDEGEQVVAGYLPGQPTTAVVGPPALDPGGRPGPRVLIEHVQTRTVGLDVTVEVELAVGEQVATGVATGPAVDGYVLRLCSVAAASAVDELLRSDEKGEEPGRCYVEHAAVVPFGTTEVALVVLLLACDGWVEQLSGSAVVSGDRRQAVVRATLAAVNRRLEGLLPS